MTRAIVQVKANGDVVTLYSRFDSYPVGAVRDSVEEAVAAWNQRAGTVI